MASTFEDDADDSAGWASEPDTCHHGVSFDVDCEDCEAEHDSDLRLREAEESAARPPEGDPRP